MEHLIIAVDFDGTLCENKWPKIGAPNEQLISWLLKQQEAGSQIILWTCRTEKMLEKAVYWCACHGLAFNAINDNAKKAVEKFGGDSRKIFADIYIDDKNCTLFDLPFTKGE